MKILISGHHLLKLKNYDIEFIKLAIFRSVEGWINNRGMSIGLSGMASGVDLWFCQSCHRLEIPYIACPPFEEQTLTIPASEIQLREWCFNNSAETWKIRNSAMVEKCDGGIIVWDGNKGGTHNVVQQMIEKKKPFTWINPVGEQVWDCY